MSENDEAFLDRWSRLKRQQPEEKAPAEAQPPAIKEPAAPLPAIEDLKPDSNFKPFMDPQVDAGTRRSALKKLFTNAHFNTPDPFEPYSIDLTGEDPIPPEMLKTLQHAQRILFDDTQKTAQAPIEKPEAPQPEAKDVAGKQDT